MFVILFSKTTNVRPRFHVCLQFAIQSDLFDNTGGQNDPEKTQILGHILFFELIKSIICPSYLCYFQVAKSTVSHLLLLKLCLVAQDQ